MDRDEWINGADGGTRTLDPRITNALLYQLSYVGMGPDTWDNCGFRILLRAVQQLGELLDGQTC